MSHLFPAVRSKMGSTVYYQASVRVQDLAALAITAGDLEEWKDWSIFERIQRDVNLKRVKNEIVPYLVASRDRFFGAFIILAYEASEFIFEPLDNVEIPGGKAYAKALEKIGFLTVSGGSLVALDGQHRLKALKEVVNSSNEYPGPYLDDVVNDELCVLFIEHEDFIKTRRIFNKVNRHVKPTSAADNIITSEDDGYSIITRWLVEDEAPLGLPKEYKGPFSTLNEVDGEPVIEWRAGRSVRQQDNKFTTLRQLCETVRWILDANDMKKFGEIDRINRPSDRELMEGYQHAWYWWTKVIHKFDCYRLALSHPHQISHYRGSEESHSLLFKPMVQVLLFRALSNAVTNRGVPFATALERATEIRWDLRGRGRHVAKLCVGGNNKVLTNTDAKNLTTDLIEYLISGEAFSSAERINLENRIRLFKDKMGYELPNYLD